MKRLIMIPGQMDDVFCMKELKYIVKKFDETYILTYPGDRKSYDQIAEEYSVKYSVIKDFTLYSLVRSISPSLLKRIGFDYELKRIIGLKKGIVNVLKCLVYVFLYINFAINANRVYEKLNNDDHDDYLYGCWMSRGAFACSFLHHNYKLKKNKNSSSVIRNCVVKAHGYDLYEERRRVNYIPFRKFIYENMNNIYFISQKGCDYYRNKYGWDDRKNHVCHLGTDEPNYRKVMKEKSRICIASCSSAWQVKRMDLIIDVISKLELDIEYIHIGDGPLLDEIKKYAHEQLDNKANVTYRFLGRVDNSKIYEIYDKYDADFFINMSDSEGLPVSIMEANAFGIPVICRDVGGNPEIVSEENGVVVHYDNNMETIIGEIRKTVICRLTDSTKYKSMSDKARSVWENSFNASKNYNMFADEVIALGK